MLTTPNEVLIEKLGLDIPPAPLLILEEISSQEAHLSWKYAEHPSSIQEHHVELNGAVIGTTKKSEMGAVISGLQPGTKYAIRVFCISTSTFQTPSAPLHIRTHYLPDGSEVPESIPSVRGVAVRNAPLVVPLTAPSMTRDTSGGQPIGRRGTNGRRPSPAGNIADAQGQDGTRPEDDEQDENLVELSQKFQKIQQEIEDVDTQIEEEDKEHESTMKGLEARRDEIKQALKERDEETSDLRKRVNKAESLSRTAQSEKTKKERLLQQKETERRKRKDDIARWGEATSAMQEEISGIEKQKAAVERRTQAEIREIRRKIDEEQKEVAMLEEDNKQKALTIKSLEEERIMHNTDEETDETREADRLDRERDERWRVKYSHMQQSFAKLWADVQLINQQIAYTREQINQAEARKANSMAFMPIAPLDMDAIRRGNRPVRRARHAGSLGSSISSPRAPFNGPEPFPPGLQYTAVTTSSPTSNVPSYFNLQNGMTLTLPTEVPASNHDELDAISSMPMSPRADSLLPADLLGDESADDLPEAVLPQQKDTSETETTPFPRIGSPILNPDSGRTETPSVGSSSAQSFSSPLQTSAPADGDEKSASSGKKSEMQTMEDEVVQPPKKPKYTSVSTMFGLNRQRGKTLAEQPPALGSLKPTQSQSFPRNVEDFDPTLEPKRRLSYGGNWAYAGSTLLENNGTQDEKQSTLSRFAATRRAFGLGNFGKSTTSSANYDPFAMRSASFDPGLSLRGDTSSPRPASTYSFDKLPRPSMESQFRAWNDKSALRNSPLAPDWGSLNSFSRSHSRRPSIVHGSTSNLSLPYHEEEVIEPDRKPSRPLQAPIGTRPASSQQSSTPKLNPAAPSFTTLFSRRGDKSKEKEKGKARESKEKVNDLEPTSPPESRKSKDTSSVAATISTVDSDTLDRIQSGTSAHLSVETPPVKPTFISKITRKASSNKFGSWKDKSSSLFSKKDATTPNGEHEEEQGSSEQLGKSLDSISTTPTTEEKKTSRTSLSNWSGFMRKNKKGLKEDLTASEISESSERSERASEISEDREDDSEA